MSSLFVRVNRFCRRECGKNGSINGNQQGRVAYRLKYGMVFLIMLAVFYFWELLPEMLQTKLPEPPMKFRNKKDKTMSIPEEDDILSSSGLPSRLTDSHSSPESLEKTNQQLSQLTLDQVLKWAHTAFHSGRREQLVHVTSFGPSGMVILHQLDALGLTPSVPIISIDTLHLFPETYDFIKSLKQTPRDADSYRFETPLQIQTYSPKAHSKTRSEFDSAYGENLYKTDYERYSYLTKVEPTVRALEQQHARAWITGRRRSQGGERANLQILEIDEMADTSTITSGKNKVVRYKLNPLALWTYDQVWDYIRKHHVPYNPLHDKGYKSVGDTMTTIAVEKTADERSGRFVGMDKTECGMHSIQAKALAAQKAAQVKSESVKTTGSSSSQDGLKKKKKHDGPEPLPCTGCLELDPTTLMDLIDSGTTDVLMEFHSPFCGHCRNFAPTYEKVAQALLDHASIDVARYDITYQKIPKKAEELGIKVTSTPTLFFVQRLPEFSVEKFKGTRTAEGIVDWIKSKTDYL